MLGQRSSMIVKTAWKWIVVLGRQLATPVHTVKASDVVSQAYRVLEIQLILSCRLQVATLPCNRWVSAKTHLTVVAHPLQLCQACALYHAPTHLALTQALTQSQWVQQHGTHQRMSQQELPQHLIAERRLLCLGD